MSVPFFIYKIESTDIFCPVVYLLPPAAVKCLYNAVIVSTKGWFSKLAPAARRFEGKYHSSCE